MTMMFPLCKTKPEDCTLRERLGHVECEETLPPTMDGAAINFSAGNSTNMVLFQLLACLQTMP